MGLELGFKHLEHISEAYVEAWGSTLEEAFENAGRAFFDIMTDVNSVEPVREVELRVEAEDLEALLFEWITALLVEFDTTGMVFSKFQVAIEETDGRFRLRAKAYGEPYDPERHPPKVEVKAMTYSLMEIKQEDSGYRIRYVVDI